MTTHYCKNEQQHKCGLNKSRHKSVTGLNRLMKFHPDPLLDNWVSNSNTDINKQTINKGNAKA
jgi:hypothetical protein